MSSAEAPTRAGRWRAWLALARVSNTPTVVADAIAGAALASAHARAGTVALVAVAVALFYTGGMILNDVLDEAVDRRVRPERPLPAGLVSRRAATLAAVAAFAAGLALLAPAGAGAVAAGAALVALIVLYDAWHKANPLSPVLMGGCRALVYVVAAVAVGGTLDARLLAAAALLLLYVVGLTQVAKEEGRARLARWPVLAVAVPVLWWAHALPRLAVALLLVAFAAWAARALWLALSRGRVGPAIGALIAGIALYDALAVAAAGGGAAALSACVAAFVLTVALQTRIAGT